MRIVPPGTPGPPGPPGPPGTCAKNEESGIFKQDDLRRMGTSRRDSSVSRGRHQLSNGGRQLDIKEEESPCLFFDIAATCDRGCSM